MSPRDHDVELVREAGVENGVGLEAIRAGAHRGYHVSEAPRILEILGVAVADLFLRRTRKLEQEADVEIAVGLAGPVTGDSAVEDLPKVGWDRDVVWEQVEQRLQVALFGRDARVALAEVLDVNDLHAELPDVGGMRLKLRAQLLEECAFADQLGAERRLKCCEVLI